MSNSILQLSSSSYTIGRAKPSEVNLPLIDVNISRKHCEFSYDQESKTWSIQDFSSNGVSVNGTRIDKNASVNLHPGDVVILSEQNDKYNWTFNLGEPKMLLHPKDSKDSNVEGVLTNLSEMLEREYQCPTCLDLFICPVALNCGHTYCWLCLARWKNSAGRTRGDLGTCPECREVVRHENRVIAMEHLIDGFMEQLGEEKKREREQKIKERKEEEEQFKATATVAALATANRAGATPVTRGRGTPVNRRGGNQRGGRGGQVRHNAPGPQPHTCLLYTSPSPRDRQKSRMPSSA